eukprot:2302952-Rhodomonas_salina.1
MRSSSTPYGTCDANLVAASRLLRTWDPDLERRCAIPSNWICYKFLCMQDGMSIPNTGAALARIVPHCMLLREIEFVFRIVVHKMCTVTTIVGQVETRVRRLDVFVAIACMASLRDVVGGS